MSNQPIDGEPVLPPKGAITVTQRKLQANRENAKKSTGPKTTTGEAFSRRNAIKHGLFASQVTDFEALLENRDEFERLLNGLWDHYHPIGKPEEIEVERIALCCWRLKRSWRYENAVNLAANRNFVLREVTDQEPYCKKLDALEQAVIQELQTANQEIEATGEVSQERKRRIFTLMPSLEQIWPQLEMIAQEQLEEPDRSKAFRKLDPEWHRRALARNIVAAAIAVIEPISGHRWRNMIETAVGRHTIGDREVVDKILRYESMTERSMSRAIDRLERLQRRRRGEPVMPLLRVDLT